MRTSNDVLTNRKRSLTLDLYICFTINFSFTFEEYIKKIVSQKSTHYNTCCCENVLSENVLKKNKKLLFL